MTVTVDHKVLVGRASSTLEVLEALENMAALASCPDGVIRVIAGQLSGRLAVKDGRTLMGALLTHSGETGLTALDTLLGVETGVFQFLDIAAAESTLHQQELGVPIAVAIAQITASEAQTAPRASTNDPIFDVINANRTLTHDQLALLDVYRMLDGTEARLAFMERNPQWQELLEANSLSPEQLQLLSAYSQLTSNEDKRSFLKRNAMFRDLMSSQSLTEEQKANLNEARTQVVEAAVQSFLDTRRAETGDTEEVSQAEILRLRLEYQQLKTRADRRAFLSKHPGFAESMTDDSMSDSQRDELQIAKFVMAEADLANFMKFQQELIGPDRQPLSDAQLTMLRTMYLELAGDSQRQVFLEQNPVLRDDLPVLRGDDVQIYVEAEAPPVVIDEEALRLQQLDALKVTARDRDDVGEEEASEFVGGKRRLAFGLRTKEERVKVGISIAAVCTLVFCIGFLALALLRNNDPTTAQFSGDDPEFSQLLSEQIEESIVSELPTTVKRHKGKGLPFHPQGHGMYYDTSAIARVDEARAMLEEAQRLLEDGLLQNAIALYEDCILQNPDYVEARIALVRALIQAKDFHRARAVCVAAMKTARLQAERDELRGLFLRLTAGTQ